MKTLGYIICFFGLLFLIGGCQKHDAAVQESFAFGQYGNFCLTSCGKYYGIYNGELYPDSSQKKIGGPLTAGPVPLDHSKYLLAKPLEDTLPKYFLDHPNQTFGCPNCVDQGGYYIEIVNNGNRTYWYIDTSIPSLPVEIRDYVTTLAATIRQLP
jgi:hypothetical protein